MSTRRIVSVKILEHGNTFVAEEIKGLDFVCPECKEKLSPTDVLNAEPDTRHTVDLTKVPVFLITVFCPNCGCKFRATVEDKR